ncbi:MAG: carbohydrate kinase, partial [Pseudomonadota bacterium]|nr:carbohydrate kinase [Pseudomonadota bacterium]
LAAAVNAPVRVSARDEAGAAGAAMMAAVATGVYPDMRSCISEWVTPLLGQAEAPDPGLVRSYETIFPVFAGLRRDLAGTWDLLAKLRTESRDETEPASSVTTGA